jgi:hypothetical protein
LTALTSFIAAVVGLIVALQSLKLNGSATNGTPATNAPPPPPASSYEVTGHVYDSDTDTGLPLVSIAYVPASPANSRPIYLTTADTSGSFGFDSAEIKSEQFPIHLEMTYKWENKTRIIPWDFAISYLSDKTPLVLSMSLKAITNSTRPRVSIQAQHLNLLLLTNSTLKFRRPATP